MNFHEGKGLREAAVLLNIWDINKKMFKSTANRCAQLDLDQPVDLISLCCILKG